MMNTPVTPPPKFLTVMMTFNKAALNVHVQDLPGHGLSASLEKTLRSRWLPHMCFLSTTVTNPQIDGASKQ